MQEEIERINTQLKAYERHFIALEERIAKLETKSKKPMRFVSGERPTLREMWEDPRIRKMLNIVFMAFAVLWGLWVSLRGY